MCKEKQANYFQLLEKAKLPTLMGRHLQDICILMYKVKCKLFQGIFAKGHSSKYNLRQSDFFTPTYNSNSITGGHGWRS